MIDVHVHCFPKFLAKRALIRPDRPNVGDYDFNATITGAVAFAREHGVRHFLSLNVVSSPRQYEDITRFVRWINGLDNRVMAVPSVHPLHPQVLEHIEQLYAAGFRGIKFQAYMQNFEMDDPRVFPVYNKIGELGMFTVLHPGRSYRTPNKSVLPAQVCRIVDQFKGAPVVCCHMGGTRLSWEERKIIAGLPVMTDTALSGKYMTQDEFDRAVELFGPDRIMFGTDLPWTRWEKEYGRVRTTTALTDAERVKVFDSNAVRMLSSCGVDIAPLAEGEPAY